MCAHPASLPRRIGRQAASERVQQRAGIAACGGRSFGLADARASRNVVGSRDDNEGISLDTCFAHHDRPRAGAAAEGECAVGGLYLERDDE